jgi:hypothetical protein
VRAIAADRTLASLTGSCAKPVNFRIYTEFCGAKGGARPAGTAGPGNVRCRTPQESRKGGKGAAPWHAGGSGAQDVTGREADPTPPQTLLNAASSWRAVRSRSRTQT